MANPETLHSILSMTCTGITKKKWTGKYWENSGYDNERAQSNLWRDYAICLAEEGAFGASKSRLQIF